MKNLLKILALVAIVGSMVFASCGPEKPAEKPVPVLTPSKNKLPEEGGTVTFNVTVDGNKAENFVITNETTGEVLAPNVNSWTAPAGDSTYDFFVTVDEVESERVMIVVGKQFYRYTLLTKFTYAACIPCVEAQASYDELSAEEKEHFVVMAVHGNADPMQIPNGLALIHEFQVAGFPEWYFNFVQPLKSAGGSATAINARNLRSRLSSAERTNPTVCGVKAKSTLDERNATVEATVKFQRPGTYKIGCVMVEDVKLEDINGQGRLPVFHNALRTQTTDDAHKEVRLTGGEPFTVDTANEERTFTFKTALDKFYPKPNTSTEWQWSGKPEACSFVVYVYYQKNEKSGFVVNNAIECFLTGDGMDTGDYRYVE